MVVVYVLRHVLWLVSMACMFVLLPPCFPSVALFYVHIYLFLFNQGMLCI